MRALLSADGREVDLHGQTVLPGLIDAHLHFLMYGLSLTEIDLIGVPTLAAAQAQVAERAANTPAGRWLGGRGWDQSLWPGAAFPSRYDLDAITAEHPVFLRRFEMESPWLPGIRSRSSQQRGFSGGVEDLYLTDRGISPLKTS